MSEMLDLDSFAAHVEVATRRAGFAIARQMRRDARQRDHPLCADLLAWQDGQIREYRPKQ